MTLTEFQKKWHIPDRVIAKMLGVEYHTYKQMKSTSPRHRITEDHIARLRANMPQYFKKIIADLDHVAPGPGP